MKQGNLSSGNLPEQNFKEQNQFHVDKSGSDIKGTGADEAPVLTIAKALTLASQADAIIVNEGTYAETVTLATQNQTIRGEGDEYGGLTEINALNATANGTSVRASRLTVLGNVNHSGNSPLYLSEMTVIGNYVSSSIAYAEIKHSRLQSGTISKIAAGILFITDSLIGNATFSTANSVISLRNVTIDAGKAVTIGAGVIYSIQDVVGAVNIDPAALPLEAAILAQGGTAEQAKAAQTESFNMLRMLDPDTNANPTKFVTYNETTKRLEVSVVPSGGKITFGTTTPPTSTGVDGEEYFVTSDGTPNGTIIEQWIHDLETSKWVKNPTPVTNLTTTSLTPLNGNGTSYVAPTLTADNNLVDEIKLSTGEMIRTGKVTWTGHGLPIHTYFFASATAPYYTSTPPESGYSQRIFFTQDANTIDIKIEEGQLLDGSATMTTAGSMVTQKVNAGVAVTMDNLSFQIPTAGARSLQVKTATGTVALSGQNEALYCASTTTAVASNTILTSLTATTTFQYLNSTYNFTTAGNVERATLYDTTNLKAYRVTVIFGASYNNNILTIERIY